ncbi:MAG: hypothetical protein JSS66_18425 [Armatimonadetes bacterium]|nr:hypothetical protein [Armatimonadota bacterium]
MLKSAVGPGAVWQFDLFGGLQATRGDEAVTRFRTRKTASLAAFLAFHQGRPQNREVLIDMFWPEANLDAGRQSLRMALSALRDTLEKGCPPGTYLEADRTFAFLHNVRTDVAQFEEDLAKADSVSTLGKALKAVRGPLLAGFDDGWIISQWLRLEEALAQATVRLMEMGAEQGEVKAAILAAKEATTILGPREDVHLGLMKLYVHDGQPGLAIAQFEELERLMEDQWGEPPSEEAYKLLDSIPKHQKAAKPRPPAPQVPARTSSFIGREEEKKALSGLVLNGSDRLVTLLGPGGSGKTALANAVALDLAPQYESRVWTVELADIPDTNRISGSVLSKVMGNADRKAGPKEVAAALGDEPCLLVLDNFEQLLPTGGKVVKEILEAAPNARAMVTSRIRLDIDGEQLFPVPPLETPPRGVPLAELAANPCVALFVERSQSVRPDFRLSVDNALAVSEIGRRLEGLPLAIELAAAKSISLSPAQILARLGSSLDFLTSRRTDVSDRHRSLRATLDWSYALLAPDLQVAFRRIGVFRGGFFLDAVGAVTGSRDFEAELGALVGASLVHSFEVEGALRFRLLEPVREFALSLMEAGELREVRERHFAHYQDVVDGATTEGEPGPGNRQWLDNLHTEHENLFTAFESVFDGVVEPGRAVKMAVVAHPFFRPRGHTHVWREAVIRLQGKFGDALPVVERASLALLVAKLSANIVDGQATSDLFSQALALCEQVGDPGDLAQCHMGVGSAHKVLGDYDTSIVHYESAAAQFEKLGDYKNVASTLRQMSMSHVSKGDHDMTYETLKRALPFARKGNDPDILAWTLTDVGVEHALHGLVDESEECFQEAHGICIQTGSSHMRSIVYWQQGEAQHRTKRYAESVATHRECVKNALDASFREGLKWMLVSCGCNLVEAGEPELGVRVIARVVKWRNDDARPLTGDEHEIIEPAKSTAASKLGEEVVGRLWSEGEQADIDALVGEILA